MYNRPDLTCVYFHGISDCLFNNDPDDPGECVYEQGIEPRNPAVQCKFYKPEIAGESGVIRDA